MDIQKCLMCGMEGNGFKCDLCGEESQSHDPYHDCGGDHLMTRCSGCNEAQLKCDCEPAK